jgi:uncharacterized protein (UPF0335 family)
MIGPFTLYELIATIGGLLVLSVLIFMLKRHCKRQKDGKIVPSHNVDSDSDSVDSETNQTVTLPKRVKTLTKRIQRMNTLPSLPRSKTKMAAKLTKDADDLLRTIQITNDQDTMMQQELVSARVELKKATMQLRKTQVFAEKKIKGYDRHVARMRKLRPVEVQRQPLQLQRQPLQPKTPLSSPGHEQQLMDQQEGLYSTLKQSEIEDFDVQRKLVKARYDVRRAQTLVTQIENRRDNFVHLSSFATGNDVTEPFSFANSQDVKEDQEFDTQPVVGMNTPLSPVPSNAW